MTGVRRNSPKVSGYGYGEWYPLAVPGGSSYVSLAPFKSREFRLTFQKAENGGRLSEIFFLTSSGQVPKPEAASW